MTLKHLQDYANDYRERFQIAYAIKVQWMNPGDDKRLAGWVHWHIEYKEADLYIAKGQPLGDVEHTIIHELLHVLLQGHLPWEKACKKRDPHYEAGLNVLAKNL